MPVGCEGNGGPGPVVDAAWFAQLRHGASVERRVADLGLPVAVWRRLLHHAADEAGLRVLTYLVPAQARGIDAGDQLVVAVLLDSTPHLSRHGDPSVLTEARH